MEQIIQGVLQQDTRLWKPKTNELNKQLLIKLVQEYDLIILNLLLENPTLKEKFFSEVNNANIFKLNEFVDFVENHCTTKKLLK
ncbi:MAG: hypothetical protein KGV51_06525 [Moraxellaceae bacterium]|nr:hypothetical protein [Moraxellaceae bacterium]